MSLGNEKAKAVYGTPELGSNDPLWVETMEYMIDQSNNPGDPRPGAMGRFRVLWDEDYLYVRVVVEDEDVYTENISDHASDSVEFYVGPGSRGFNQWRISATGLWSGQNAEGRAGWTELTDAGYVVEVRIPKGHLEIKNRLLTFDVYINNSSSDGNDRYEVVSAFGEPDAAFLGHETFEDSLMLIEADVVDERFSIRVKSGLGGHVSPTGPGNVFRVAGGEERTFTFIPESGQVLDRVMLDGVEVCVTAENTYTLENVSANHTIYATFKNDPDAELLHFIVWNDHFARGEYTTAVIIDLGEGHAIADSDLNVEMFTVSFKNTTLDGLALAFEGRRKIVRVYANDEPTVLGYLGLVENSPDYRQGLERGRYIVVEFEFYTETGGMTTLDGQSNSTLQKYTIIQNEALILTRGRRLDYVVFKQEKVVNVILDQFEVGNRGTFNYSLYLHKGVSDEVVKGLPLFVYTHGGGRGGGNAAIDQKAAMKSTNGAVALMKKMAENPDKFLSHVLNISYSFVHTPDTADVKDCIDDLVEKGLVDPSRIYVAGFSTGSGYTNKLLNAYPGFFAAGVPMVARSGTPDSSIDEAHKNLAYWLFVNSYDDESYQTNLNNFIEDILPAMNNGRASLFDSNRSFVWPYNQFEQKEQNPPLEPHVAHEVEAAILYNKIEEKGWNVNPIAGTLDSRYVDVFEWLFDQGL